jgi:uncharacterized protein YggE
MFNENTIVGKRMNSLVTVFVIVLIIFLGVGTLKTFGIFGNSKELAVSNTNFISVSGKGEVIAIPDIATFNFSVIEQASTVSDAQNKVTAKINKTIETLKSLGVEERDIKTVNYNTYPKYEYFNQVCTAYSCPPSGSQKLIGYEVQQNIMVKIRNIADSGKVLGAIGSTGVSDISGLNFTVDDYDVKMREARKMAIEDAKTQAQQLAKDLGVKLVSISNFSESGNYPMPMYSAKDMTMGMGGANESAPQIPTGENKITSNVSIVYEIK